MPTLTLKFTVIVFTLLPLVWQSAGLRAEDWPIDDPALKTCITEAAHKKNWRQMEEVSDLRCHSMGIKNVNGLENFSGLTSLSLHNNDIDTLDPSHWPRLQVLNVAKNKLQRLEVKNLTQLEQLYVFSNSLNTLLLENLPQLEQFKANSNGMLTFQSQQLPLLSKVYLFDNELEAMDIYQLPSLKYMDVRQNPMPDELYEEMDRLKGVTVLHDGNEEDWQ